jgi:hypothetical protein
LSASRHHPHNGGQQFAPFFSVAAIRSVQSFVIARPSTQMVQIDYRLKQQQQRCFQFFSIGESFPAVYLFDFFCPSADKTVQPFALSIDSQPNRNGWLPCTALIIIFQSRFNGRQRRAGENAPPLRRVVHVRGGPASATHNISRLLMIFLSGPKGDSLRDKTREFSIFWKGRIPCWFNSGARPDISAFGIPRT